MFNTRVIYYLYVESIFVYIISPKDTLLVFFWNFNVYFKLAINSNNVFKKLMLLEFFNLIFIYS